ncbi:MULTISPECIES: LPS assembly lipoprotein LptE [unclassified Methylophilus]|uniref:LPS-assembly lipoprotein LptE n=1 Tax=Methylophilus glucosoxydans TaxID=752553 RepID=A0ABW3GJA3_9PROT|nr:MULTISPECIES: LPS assembly lipoprotein LptE [unclassified Methylophilus]MDT7848220.1 LPS assembly lipoprotein LptE [Methylophilus sp. VKM B-3414]
MQQTTPTRWIHAITLWCSIAVLTALLSACGFHLRQPSPIAFKTIFIKGSTQINIALKKALVEQGVKVVTDAEEAELQLELLKEENEQRILSLSGTGVVREYELYYRVQYRTKVTGEPTWALPLIMEGRRDYTYNDANLLAKQAEQKMLSDSMQLDVLNGIMRRLSALKKAE